MFLLHINLGWIMKRKRPYALNYEKKKAYGLFLFIIQPKLMCRRNITYTNNASSSLSLLSQIIATIPCPALPSSLFSYTSLLSIYLDWKPGPRCKGDSTLQLWCRAWSVWLSSGLLSQKNSFLEQCCGSIPVNCSIINLVLGIHCDLYTHRIDNCSLREGSRVRVFFLGTIVYLFIRVAVSKQ